MEAIAVDHAHTDTGDKAANVVGVSSHSVGSVSRGRRRPRGGGQGCSVCAMVLANLCSSYKNSSRPHCDVSFYQNVKQL